MSRQGNQFGSAQCRGAWGTTMWVHGTQSNFRGRRTTGIPLEQIGCEKGWMRKYTFVSNWMAVDQASNEATRVVNWLSIHKQRERWGLPLDGRAECAGQPLGRPTHGLEKWPAARAAYCKCNCVGHGNLRAPFETKLHWKSALAQIFAWSSSPLPLHLLILNHLPSIVLSTCHFASHLLHYLHHKGECYKMAQISDFPSVMKVIMEAKLSESCATSSQNLVPLSLPEILYSLESSQSTKSYMHFKLQCIQIYLLSCLDSTHGSWL